MAQLKTVWLHMGINVWCDNEERSFYIMRSINTFIKVSKQIHDLIKLYYDLCAVVAR